MIQPADPPKSVVAATLLSCIAGVGQIYLGQMMKGIVILGVAIVVGVPTSGLVSLPVMIFAMVDAYLMAKRLEAGSAVGEWEFFWTAQK